MPEPRPFYGRWSSQIAYADDKLHGEVINDWCVAAKLLLHRKSKRGG
jgi:hypothetical protein